MSKIKDVSSIGFADIVGTGITGFFWFFIATVLEPSQYGQIFYFLGIAGIGATIALIGTNQTIMVYVAKKVKIQSTLYLISLLVGSITSLIIIIIFYRIDASLVLFGYIINNLAIGEILGKKLYSTYRNYVLIQKILTLVLGIGFFYAFGVEGIIFALALSYIFYAIRIYKGFKESEINFSLLKPRLGFISNNYLMQITQVSRVQADKLIIAPILGFTLLGNYSLALQIVMVSYIIPLIVFKYVLPQEISGHPNKKLKKLTILVSVITCVIGILVTPYLAPTMFPKYSDVIEPMQIMFLHLIPATIFLMYTSTLLSLEKSKFVLIGRIIASITLIIGMIVLGHIFGIIGIAVAFVLSSTSSVIFLVIILRIKRIDNMEI